MTECTVWMLSGWEAGTRQFPRNIAHHVFHFPSRDYIVACGQNVNFCLQPCCFILCVINPLNPELNPICYFLALLGAHHFLNVSRIRVKLLTFRLLMSYIYMEHPFLMFLDHTQRRSTVGRTPLDEWSARHRDLYLTTHDTHNRQISIPPVGFEPKISAGERQGMDICLLW